MANTREKSNFRAQDGSACESTSVPNAFFDEAMSELSFGALRIYLLTLKASQFRESEFIAPLAAFKSLTGILDERTLRSGIKELVDLGMMNKTLLTDQEAYLHLKQGSFESGCHFCGFDKTFLDAHHYPVRAADGGTETVDACANCHRLFHQLTDYGLFGLSNTWLEEKSVKIKALSGDNA